MCGGALAISFASACGGSGETSSADDARLVGERLIGRWMLVRYRPDEALEASLSSLLMAQLGTMTLELDGQNLRASGLGVNALRSYRVVRATGDQFQLLVSDPDGVTYEVVGRLEGPEIVFRSLTSPWRGQGRLRRL